jgi:hypothetical protein
MVTYPALSEGNKSGSSVPPPAFAPGGKLLRSQAIGPICARVRLVNGPSTPCRDVTFGARLVGLHLTLIREQNKLFKRGLRLSQIVSVARAEGYSI